MIKKLSSLNWSPRGLTSSWLLVASWLIGLTVSPLLYAQQRPVVPGQRGSQTEDEPYIGRQQRGDRPSPAIKWSEPRPVVPSVQPIGEAQDSKHKRLPQAQPAGGAGEVKPGQVIKAEQLNKGDLDRLPDNQVIDVKGQRMTAEEIRRQMQQARVQAEIKAKEGAQKAQAEFEAYRTKFSQDQQARLQAENAKIQAEFARLRQQPRQTPQPAGQSQLDAVRGEARQLLERSKTASPAERAQIEQRAEQLLQQVDQMGVRGPAGAQQPASQMPRPRPMGR